MLGKTVERILAGIAACRQRQRPNRSFPRLSRKPAANGGPARQPQLQPQPEARKTGPPAPEFPLKPLNECCLAVKRMPLGTIRGSKGRSGVSLDRSSERFRV